MSFQKMCPEELLLLKKPTELPHFWDKRYKFLLKNNGKFPIDRLISLSHAYIHMEEYDAEYPEEIMQLVNDSKPEDCTGIVLGDSGLHIIGHDRPISSSEEDLHRNIALSGFGDMLHDDERNRAFDEAIKKCVFTLVHSKEFNPAGDRHFKCCDIGTGSGLLSMMVARAFLNLDYKKFHITAFEQFNPMAKCAESIISTNGFSEYITVIKKRPVDCDIKNPQFDLLVAELLDTELHGEGCLYPYIHAIEELCSPKCLFVPHQARIYIEPISSFTLFSRNSIDDLELNLNSSGTNKKLVKVRVPEEFKNCPGLQSLDDMHLDMLLEDKDFIRITEPKVAFELTFNNLDSLKLHDHVKIDFSITKKIEQPPVIAMWWDIVMFDRAQQYPKTEQANEDEENGENDSNEDLDLEVLSCAPVWARSFDMKERDRRIKQIYGRDVWRDHWLQGIYYLVDVRGTRELIGREPGSQLTIHAYHDDFSWAFDLQDKFEFELELPTYCDCSFHRSIHRSDLSHLNDSNIMKKLLDAWLYDERKSEIECELQVKKGPGRGWQIDLISTDGVPRSIKPLIDPEFTNPGGPWRNVMIWFGKNQSNMGVIESFEIKFTQVHFDNLNRVYMDRNNCEGFDLSLMDILINKSIEAIELPQESYHLWEYGGKRCDREDHVLFSLEKDGIQAIERIMKGHFKRRFKLAILKNCIPNLKNGLALVFWVEFKLAKTGQIISTGPVKNSTVGSLIEWNRNCLQTVYFLHNKPEVDTESLFYGVDLGFNPETTYYNRHLQLKIKII